jgi:hypothetical protein
MAFRRLALPPLLLCMSVAACSDDSSSERPGGDALEAGTGGASGDAAVDAPGDDPYADDARWICKPGIPDDVCAENLDATILNADGTTELEPHVKAEDPAIDCFYVYPTISFDSAPNSDFEVDREVPTVREQVARLSSVCAVYAPIYRQVTLSSLFGTLPPDAGVPDRELAYSDASAAFHYYMAHHNKGRGFVLVGHSQGSGILRRLIQEEIDGDESMRGQLVSALLIGGGLAVPEDADVGQDFQNVPLCRETSDVGCAVAYSTFRSNAPPPANSLFGKPRTGPGIVACNNPAALDGGKVMLAPYFTNRPGAVVAIQGADDVTTPFVKLPDFIEGECIEKDGYHYLEATIHGDPDDPRPDDIPGDLSPEWGLHLVDVHVAMGDLETLVKAQAAAYAAR